MCSITHISEISIHKHRKSVLPLPKNITMHSLSSLHGFWRQWFATQRAEVLICWPFVDPDVLLVYSINRAVIE